MVNRIVPCSEKDIYHNFLKRRELQIPIPKKKKEKTINKYRQKFCAMPSFLTLVPQCYQFHLKTIAPMFLYTKLQANLQAAVQRHPGFSALKSSRHLHFSQICLLSGSLGFLGHRLLYKSNK